MSYQGTGIAPDIYVYPTPQGIAEGRDEVLEKAIEVALEFHRQKAEGGKQKGNRRR
jgi:C-terminal processing protease CtpA/Prc